ncbi:MAG: glycerol-3-phosphate 1-O-acyltransferase PlsY [Syntrophomonadaceae bacterium]|nr:glycerol-3-phosphate 1-O-acyltransferase PlsY [Syntrophomonadaceae bacterium]NLX03270.1 glycerol-3-phosphate 1-O-acyltransferase PlsY [Syntrophomonadaceae bacterium]
MKEVLVVILCYLIGSIPFSYISAQILAHTDVRSRGSGNVGATNVYRTSGAWAAIPALAGDLLKGAVAAWLGLAMGGPIMVILCSLAAVIGHCYPLFLKFRGGKAVATAGGVVLFLMPKVGLVLLLLFITVLVVTRYVSLGSVIVAISLPFVAYLFHNPWQYTMLSALLMIVVVYRHRENISRLKAGSEARIGDQSWR